MKADFLAFAAEPMHELLQLSGNYHLHLGSLIQFRPFPAEHAMATSMTSQSPAEPPTKAPALSPSRQPLPLSASQESQVRELYHKRVRNKCADEVRGRLINLFLLTITPRYVNGQGLTKTPLAHRLRFVRHEPHLHRHDHVPARAKSNEHMHDEVRQPGRDGRRAGGMVRHDRPAEAAARGEGGEAEEGRGVLAPVVG